MKHRGFTLVELAIVFIVIGLMVGGVLVGQNLIRGSELSNVSKAFQEYDATVQTFRDKYSFLPGDFSQATRFWGSAGGTGADAACVAAQTFAAAATCNGNGNGRIDDFPNANAERFLAWKHLANAEMISGLYSGVTDGAAGTFIANPGLNVPGSQVSDSGYYDLWSTQPNAAVFFADSDLPNVTVSLVGPAAGGFGVLSPEDAWNIDSKLDDGSPVTGRVFTTRNSSAVGGGCADGNAIGAQYDRANPAAVCLLYYITF